LCRPLGLPAVPGAAALERQVALVTHRRLEEAGVVLPGPPRPATGARSLPAQPVTDEPDTGHRPTSKRDVDRDGRRLLELLPLVFGGSTPRSVESGLAVSRFGESAT
jgi:hypothetical protein